MEWSRSACLPHAPGPCVGGVRACAELQIHLVQCSQSVRVWQPGGLMEPTLSPVDPAVQGTFSASPAHC
jgi:hypothetical protein